MSLLDQLKMKKLAALKMSGSMGPPKVNWTKPTMAPKVGLPKSGGTFGQLKENLMPKTVKLPFTNIASVKR